MKKIEEKKEEWNHKIWVDSKPVYRLSNLNNPAGAAYKLPHAETPQQNLAFFACVRLYWPTNCFPVLLLD